MKKMPYLSAFGAVVLACATPLLAQNNGVSANGTFQFSSGGAAKSISFDVRQHTSSGGASGQMSFSGPAVISGQDVDGDGTPDPGTLTNLTVKVQFDCLVVNGNRAAMSGKITESSLPALVGRQSILAVEDNGEGSKATGPDRFTWGLYRSTAITWTPSDAEVPGDNGWTLTWIATDAERPDDAGVPSKKSDTVDCKAFPLSSYSFEEVPQGGGNIQVKP
jgi:hypothetical protein